MMTIQINKYKKGRTNKYQHFFFTFFFKSTVMYSGSGNKK